MSGDFLIQLLLLPQECDNGEVNVQKRTTTYHFEHSWYLDETQQVLFPCILEYHNIGRPLLIIACLCANKSLRCSVSFLSMILSLNGNSCSLFWYGIVLKYFFVVSQFSLCQWAHMNTHVGILILRCIYKETYISVKVLLCFTELLWAWNFRSN